MATTLPGRKVAFSHFGVSCIDVDRMVEFYTTTLGMALSDRGAVELKGRLEIAFLTTDPADHHQFVLAGGRRDTAIDMSPFVGGVIGANVFQISFRLDSLETVRRVIERFRAAGIESFTPVNHGNAWAVYTRDIEGNGVELFVDTPWQVHQPCALPLDLSLSDAEILEATEAYCTAQPECEPYAAWSERMAGTIVANQAGI